MRKVTVYIFRLDDLTYGTIALAFSVNAVPIEDLELHDHFLTDKSLFEILDVYTKKIEAFASLMDKPYYYRLVIRDSHDRIVRIIKR